MTVFDSSNLIVRRAKRDILDRVSLHAESGDFIAVIGANGAGKSTFLSVLAGLLKPDAGTVRLDQDSIWDLSRQELARRRAYLPQNELHDLIVELRSLTLGVGSFSHKFDHMQELTGKPAEKVIASRAQEAAQ